MGKNLRNDDGPGNLRSIANPQGTLTGDRLPTPDEEGIIDIGYDVEFIENKTGAQATILVKPVLQDEVITAFPGTQEYFEHVLQDGDRISVTTFNKIKVAGSLGYNLVSFLYHLAV